MANQLTERVGNGLAGSPGRTGEAGSTRREDTTFMGATCNCRKRYDALERAILIRSREWHGGRAARHVLVSLAERRNVRVDSIRRCQDRLLCDRERSWNGVLPRATSIDVL